MGEGSAGRVDGPWERRLRSELQTGVGTGLVPGGREGGLWGTRSRWGARLTGVGLRGGPRRTLAELRSLGTTWGTRRDAVSGGLGRRVLEALECGGSQRQL